jgi:hypothetical protein
MDTLTLAYERGKMDSYYKRNPRPHYWTEGGTCSPTNREVTKLTLDEQKAYARGYKDNTIEGDFKDYGNDNMPKEL